jgi:hypothetical protein
MMETTMQTVGSAGDALMILVPVLAWFVASIAVGFNSPTNPRTRP